MTLVGSLKARRRGKKKEKEEEMPKCERKGRALNYNDTFARTKRDKRSYRKEAGREEGGGDSR